MVALGISEFTFGYAFLFEQTRRHFGNLYAAPVLPSLIQETEEGWDAHLPVTGVDYYYQFKLSDYLVRRNATFFQDGTYNDPYFRIAMYRNHNNRQHHRLKAHARLHPYTYYVAPEITPDDDFNTIFLNEQITRHSRLIPLDECDDIHDDRQHYITFQLNDPNWIFHSEKKKHENSILGESLGEFYQASLKKKKTLDWKFAKQLFKTTSNNVREILDIEQTRFYVTENQSIYRLLNEDIINESRENIFKRVSQIFLLFYGITMIIVADRGNEIK